jgi:poly(3-hydroxybutyrate) depolymerase
VCDIPVQFLAGSNHVENLFLFDQTQHFSGDISLDDEGFIYIPTACADRTTPCRLHVAIHGCSQGRSFVGSEFAEHNGMNEWAETNNVIILYPNAKADAAKGNPEGCWDWWGYLGSLDYDLKSGPQMAFMKSIMDTVLGGA